MFKKQEADNFKEAETIIGPSVKVEGDFVGQGNIIVDGVIKGSVTTNGNLRVGDQAKITAAVAAANAQAAHSLPSASGESMSRGGLWWRFINEPRHRAARHTRRLRPCRGVRSCGSRSRTGSRTRPRA